MEAARSLDVYGELQRVKRKRGRRWKANELVPLRQILRQRGKPAALRKALKRAARRRATICLVLSGTLWMSCISEGFSCEEDEEHAERLAFAYAILAYIMANYVPRPTASVEGHHEPLPFHLYSQVDFAHFFRLGSVAELLRLRHALGLPAKVVKHG